MRNCASTAALFLLSLLLTLSPQAMAQSSPYRTLVDSYREGGRADVDAVLAMPRDTLTAAVDAAVSGAASWPWEELRAAAMLQSEVCVAVVDKGDAPACEFHIRQAQRLLGRTVAVSPPQEDFEWRWYQVVQRVLSEMGLKTLARRLTTEADAKWRSDAARASYLRGLELESRGLHEAIVSPPTGAGLALVIPTQAVYFTPAAEAFARALKQKPGFSAAALHLGRIQMLQGQRAEAAESFRSAVDATDPSVSYLSALFLGSIEEREEHLIQAEALYRKALQRVPYSQSAPLALAELLSRTGREAEARQTLSARLLRINTEILEPFWTYGPLDEASGTRFDLLRIEVWK